MKYALWFCTVLGLVLGTISGCSGSSPHQVPPRKVAELLPSLKDRDPMVRSIACASIAIAAEGTDDKGVAIAALEEMLTDPDERVRQVVEGQLQKLRGGD